MARLFQPKEYIISNFRETIDIYDIDTKKVISKLKIEIEPFNSLRLFPINSNIILLFTVRYEPGGSIFELSFYSIKEQKVIHSFEIEESISTDNVLLINNIIVLFASTVFYIIDIKKKEITRRKGSYRNAQSFQHPYFPKIIGIVNNQDLTLINIYDDEIKTLKIQTDKFEKIYYLYDRKNRRLIGLSRENGHIITFSKEDPYTFEHKLDKNINSLNMYNYNNGIVVNDLYIFIGSGNLIRYIPYIKCELIRMPFKTSYNSKIMYLSTDRTIVYYDHKAVYLIPIEPLEKGRGKEKADIHKINLKQTTDAIIYNDDTEFVKDLENMSKLLQGRLHRNLVEIIKRFL